MFVAPSVEPLTVNVQDYIACKAWIISNAKSKADLLAGPFADFVRTHKRWANAVLKQSAACPKACQK